MRLEVLTSARWRVLAPEPVGQVGRRNHAAVPERQQRERGPAQGWSPGRAPPPVPELDRAEDTDPDLGVPGVPHSSRLPGPLATETARIPHAYPIRTERVEHRRTKPSREGYTMTTKSRREPDEAPRHRSTRPSTWRRHVATLTAISALTLGGIFVGPASGATSDVEHTIRAVRTADGAYEVVVDGQAAATVEVSDLAYEVETAVSTDGHQAAVITDHDGTSGAGLAMLDVTSGKLQTVTDATVTSAAFATDDRLAFVTLDGDDATVSIRVGDQTTPVAEMPDAEVRVLGWTTGDDGLLVAQRAIDPGNFAPESVARVDVATGALIPVVTSDTTDVYTGFTLATIDGERLLGAIRKDSVYPCGHDESSLLLVDEDGTVRKEAGRTSDTYRSAIWSDDGTQVAYELQGCVSAEQKAADSAAAYQRMIDTNGTYVLDLGTGSATKIVSGVSSAYQLSDLRDGAVVLGSSRVAEKIVEPGSGTTAEGLDAASGSTMAPQQKVIPNVHIHQLWDTADDFNGSWACGPTSAVMDMASYQLPDEFAVDVSSPWPHRSPYGGYVSKIYSAYGYTFDTNVPDPSGNPAYGAWSEATDGYQAYAYMIVNYLDKHIDYGIGELDDVDPAWVRTQIDNNLMVLAMGNYSPAGWGHVATIVGYTDDGRFIVNDPYGPNTDGSYGGKEQVYTWEWMTPHYLIAA